MTVTDGPPNELRGVALTVEPPPVKPGYKTTEFWLTVSATLLTALFASGLLTSSTALAIAGMAATVLTALGYKVTRAQVKVAAAGALLALVMTSSQLACTPAQRTTAGHATVDCISANAAAIADVLASMRAKPELGGCAAGQGSDWGCVRSKAIPAGVVIGGCAFLELITADESPKARVAAATDLPPPERPGRQAFESYRASVAGGAAFRTAEGER